LAQDWLSQPGGGLGRAGVMRALPLAGLLALAGGASAESGRSGWGGELQYDLLGLDQSTDNVLSKGEPLDDANAEGMAAAARFASRLRLAQDKPQQEEPALVLKPEAPLRLPSLADTAAHPDAAPNRPLPVDSERAHVAADDDPLQAVEREIDTEDLSPRAHLAAVGASLQASKATAAAPDALPTQDRTGALADLAGDLKHREKLAGNATAMTDADIKELNDFDEDEAKDPTPEMGKMSAAEAAEEAKFAKEEAEERKLDEDPDADPAPVVQADAKAETEAKADDTADGLQNLAKMLGKSEQDDEAVAAHQAYVAKEAHQARLAKEARAHRAAAKPVEKALRTGHA